VKYLTTLQIIAIHDQLIKRFGGSQGIREMSLLESAVHRPEATFDGADLYKTIFDKSAVLFHSILKNHAFVDGNKRTAYSASALFLKMNGYDLSNLHGASVEFSVRVETDNLKVEEISMWLKKNSKKI